MQSIKWRINIALRTLGLRHLVVATKVDKLTQNERASGATLEKLRLGLGLPPDEAPVPFSSTDVGAMQGCGLGVKDVWGFVKDAILAMEEEEEEEEGAVDGVGGGGDAGGLYGHGNGAAADEERRGGFLGTGDEAGDEAAEGVDYFLTEDEFDESDFEDAASNLEQGDNDSGSEDGSRLMRDDDLFAFSDDDGDGDGAVAGDRPW